MSPSEASWPLPPPTAEREACAKWPLIGGATKRRRARRGAATRAACREAFRDGRSEGRRSRRATRGGRENWKRVEASYNTRALISGEAGNEEPRPGVQITPGRSAAVRRLTLLEYGHRERFGGAGAAGEPHAACQVGVIDELALDGPWWTGREREEHPATPASALAAAGAGDRQPNALGTLEDALARLQQDAQARREEGHLGTLIVPRRAELLDVEIEHDLLPRYVLRLASHPSLPPFQMLMAARCRDGGNPERLHRDFTVASGAWLRSRPGEPQVAGEDAGW